MPDCVEMTVDVKGVDVKHKMSQQPSTTGYLLCLFNMIEIVKLLSHNENIVELRFSAMRHFVVRRDLSLESFWYESILS